MGNPVKVSVIMGVYNPRPRGREPGGGPTRRTTRPGW